MVAKTNVFGREVEAVITGTPRLNAKEQTITLSDARISVAGVNLPDFTAQALLAALLRPIPLKGLPLGLTASRISCRRGRRACGPGGRQPDRCRLGASSSSSSGRRLVCSLSSLRRTDSSSGPISRVAPSSAQPAAIRNRRKVSSSAFTQQEAPTNPSARKVSAQALSSREPWP